MTPRPEKPSQTPAPPPGQRPNPPPGGLPPGIGLIGVGAILTSMILSGLLLGYWTDAWLDTSPLFMLLFAGLGLIGGLMKVHRLLV